MAISQEYPTRGSSYSTMTTLEDRFELIREIGDGSFGSVALARVRTAGANVARRGTMVSRIVFEFWQSTDFLGCNQNDEEDI